MRILITVSSIITLLCLLSYFIFFSQDYNGGENPAKTLFVSAGGKINTLDPALASDLTSSYMVASLYDTLLQYDYTARPYKLIPSMLSAMPLVTKDLKEFKFTLRDDLYFQKDKCFSTFSNSSKGRKVTSKDVVFSFLRIADGRNHSPGFWLFRDKILGINKFREQSAKLPPWDFSIYDKGCEGFEIVDDHTFIIKIAEPDPRLLYVLAMPYSSVVPHEAVKLYKENFAEHPVGSGPFKLVEWRRDYSIILDKNENYRYETFSKAKNIADREKQLPLSDRVVCYLVKQPLSGWLMFLQGELDISTLDKDNFDAVVDKQLKLVGALDKRGINMLQLPEFQINYVGFSFTDPILADNLNLRKAISHAYNVENRVKHLNYRIIPANGPIPPGVPGYNENFKNPYSEYNLNKAKIFLKQAGYPNGIDTKTGERLELTFDQSGDGAAHRQMAEFMVEDMAKIGIKIKPLFNNKPRFFQKLRKGELQLFRMSWIGDYPDAENFLQLFYGENGGSCNRAYFKDDDFDFMYKSVIKLPDCPQRTKEYSALAQYLTTKCPWIFESYPISYRLIHSWLENYIPHDFAFSRWKYLSFDPSKRAKVKSIFEPISMGDLRN